MRNIIDKIADTVLSNVVKVLGIALLVTVVLQVLSRWLPIQMVWTDELARLLFVWFSMLSVAVACIENKHLTLDLLYDKFSPKVQKWVNFFAKVLVFATAILLCYEGFKILPLVQIQTSPTLQISMAWFYASVPVGFVFVVIHMFFELIGTFSKRKDDDSLEKER